MPEELTSYSLYGRHIIETEGAIRCGDRTKELEEPGELEPEPKNKSDPEPKINPEPASDPETKSEEPEPKEIEEPKDPDTIESLSSVHIV